MTTNINLSNVCVGRSYCILGYELETSEYAQKLRKMGFVEGTPIELAPIKISDPMIFQIRGSRVALRKIEAKQIKVGEL
ncbi:FeoA family protein [Maridesulfovibrio hydrothermalis]|uniref:FeoA family protein n=1 Tax=Maridesulfovibrio hydrothermalis AM13 = DSM 14728 TaxID=1121451 RepID=L0RFP2_9BACT|nr:FeoA family protein [Maridesulfovibrio hydrothermalis]CCO25042.1 FeoA family protein [Maridesulfovibrio hydrothermalis AM13 = DSM 14728]